ncbi:MAG TPA: serine/threonine-protein kinase, partial [Kofleriaceae bacterium]|nr:serine/threonine-protein kinase [Kofleriaceae bacterium]
MATPEGQDGAIESLPTERLGAEVPATHTAGGETLAPGAVLVDRYRVVRFVARGGMGEVYEAEDMELGARVAIKTIRPAIAGDPSAIARFRREIQVARTVTHPNVCRVFDLAHGEGPAGPLAFFTMELLRGVALDERLRRGPIARDEARGIMADVVAGLGAAHAADIVHRDLKPANVMLLADGRAVITDFGLARPVGAPKGSPAVADGSGDTTVAGTPAYMAPEVIAGEPPSRASDLYALGVVMTELQTGALPTAGAKPWWRDRRWEAAARRCLATVPAQRLPDAAGVLAAVRGRPARRWAALAVAALAIAIAAAVIAWPRGSSGPPPDAIRAPDAADAARAHTDGVARLRVLDGASARAHLRTAAARAPGFAPTLAELSAAERLAGDPLAARAAAAEAVAAVAAAPGRWTRAERLLVEARRAEANDDWLAAADAWAALDGFAPDT